MDQLITLVHDQLAVAFGLGVSAGAVIACAVTGIRAVCKIIMRIIRKS